MRGTIVRMLVTVTNFWDILKICSLCYHQIYRFDCVPCGAGVIRYHRDRISGSIQPGFPQQRKWVSNIID